jgi:Flp pilus assembly protein TadD
MPQIPSPSAELLVDVQRQAEQLLSKGQAQQAVDLLDRVSEDLSGYPGLYRLKGVARLLQGSNTEARLIFDELEGSFGDDPGFLNVYGVALRRERDLGKAREVYERALELQPDEPSLLSNLGNLMIDLGQLQLARTHLSRALELAPGHGDARQNMARLERTLGGGAVESLGSAHVAAPQQHPANISAAAPPRDEEAAADWLKLAATAQREGNFDEAIVFARRAIEAQTDLAPAYKLAGEVLAGLRRFDQAEQALLYGALLGEADTNTLSNLGGICASRGQAPLAGLLLRRVLQQQPEHKVARQNLELLEKKAATGQQSLKTLF